MSNEPPPAVGRQSESRDVIDCEDEPRDSQHPIQAHTYGNTWIGEYLDGVHDEENHRDDGQRPLRTALPPVECLTASHCVRLADHSSPTSTFPTRCADPRVAHVRRTRTN